MNIFTKTYAFLLPVLIIITILLTCSISLSFARHAQASYHFATFTAHSPLHIYATTGKAPIGMTPAEIKKIYNLPATGGKGTVVIVSACVHYKEWLLYSAHDEQARACEYWLEFGDRTRC